MLDCRSDDVVTHLLQKLCELVPEVRGDVARQQSIEAHLRLEFGGQTTYVAASGKDYAAMRAQVRERFNGRNASTLARELGVGRATVYRWLKQPGE